MTLYDLYDDMYEVWNWKGYNDSLGLGSSNLNLIRDWGEGLQAVSEEGHGHDVGLGPDSEPWLAGLWRPVIR